jgi:hypothetical protein
MIYFETGLHYHLIDAKVMFASRFAWLVYKFIEESMPESFESINLLFKDQSEEDWSSLSLHDLTTSFILLGYCFAIILFVFYLELLHSFLINYSI